MIKATFVLDEESVRILKRTATRLGQSQSWVVRDSIKGYRKKSGGLSLDERRQRVAVLTSYLERSGTGDAAAVRKELDEIRESRRHGGRRHPI